MKKYLLTACAALALGGSAPAVPAQAGEFACMRDGPMSQACEIAQTQREQQNERRALREQERQRAQPYYRSYRLPY